eukprot:SAG31_NODE_21102_length_558_cov_0.588235_1_plen_51_part_10
MSKPAMSNVVKDLSPPIVDGSVPLIPDGSSLCVKLVSKVRLPKESGIVPDN